MTFRSLDEYEQYIEQVNEQHYEELAMKEQEREEFNKLMEEFNNEIYQQTGVKQKEKGLEYTQKEVERGGPMLKTDPGAVDKAVNQPSHYDWFGETAFDVISRVLNTEELIGALKFNSLKYRLRAGKKGKLGPQDIAKAEWYERKYDEFVRENSPQ